MGCQSANVKCKGGKLDGSRKTLGP
jgi:hypothetical protein